MATAKKLPSGSWRVRIYDYTDSNGKQHYKSFTAKTKKEAEKAAVNYMPQDRTSERDMTFEECADAYILRRSPVSSASTIREYTGYRNRYMASLSKIPVWRITQEDVQREINTLAAGLSPKTVRNVHGFISAVLAEFRPDFALHTALPKRVPPKLYVPTEAELQRLMEEVSGTVMELPVLLAAFGPMRRGEICALTMADLQGDYLHINKDMVLSPGKEWIVKDPKTAASNRSVLLPHWVADRIRERGHITDLKPNEITNRFRR